MYMYGSFIDLLFIIIYLIIMIYFNGGYVKDFDFPPFDYVMLLCFEMFFFI